MSRDSYLTRAAFVALGADALGGYGWKGRLSRLVGVRNSTITRYTDGAGPCQKWLAVILVLAQHTPPDILQQLIEAGPVIDAEASTSRMPPRTDDT